MVSPESRDSRGKAAVTKQRPEAGSSQLAPLFAKGLRMLQLLGFLQFSGRFLRCHGFSPDSAGLNRQVVVNERVIR